MAMTFREASETLATARDPSAGKPIGRNTRLFRRNGDTYAIRYHETDIVLIHRDGTYTLNNGSWFSVTTKQRINLYSPARLYQRNHFWYLSTPSHGEISYDNGVRIDTTGTPVRSNANASD